MPAIERELAYAKLTRGLRVVGRRADGFHLIEAEMVTIDLADELVFSAAPRIGLEVVDAIDWVGPAPHDTTAPAPVDATNLVFRALELAGTPAAVRLTKRIPPGAGLGGGSADAAAALRYGGIKDPDVAVRLGADVPFCLLGGRAAVSGIGEVVEPLELGEQTFVVLTPDLVVETRRVYAAFDELGPGEHAGEGLGNDLEQSALAVEPRLHAYRELFTDVAGERPLLAGSGASFFVECRPDSAQPLRLALCRELEARGARALVSVGRATANGGGRPR